MKIKLAYIFAIITCLFMFFIYNQSFHNVELQLQDALMQQERDIDYRVAILAIDDESLHAIGQWPWPRDVHAKVIRELADSAAVVGFDITFPLASEDPTNDEALITAVGAADNVVLARYGMFDKYAQLGMIEAIGLSDPFPALRDAGAALGHLNTFPDEDGVVRSALLRFSHQGQLVEHFSYVIAQQYAEKMGETLTFDEAALNKIQQFHINYAGGPGQFEVIPYSMVYNGDIPADYFEDRIVLVGPYTVGIKDDFFTPMDKKQSMYGVEIHANIIQNLLEENFKKELGWYWNTVILIAMSILAYTICRMKSPVLSLAILAVVATSFTFGAKFVYDAGFILAVSYVLLLLAVLYISAVAYNYLTELAERKRITSIFGRYVAPQVVNEILENGEDGLKLGGSRKDVTILFVDIRGFTTLSERVEPEEIVEILNEYLDLTANCVFDYGGTLDKFIGDATMAIYNAPLPLEEHALQAVRSAWAMKEKSIALQQQLEERFGKSVQFGIGIHSGAAVIGNIGSKTRMDYTAIGDTVNTAARLESNSKPGQIIISETVYEQVKDHIVVHSLGEIHVKGKVQGILIYEVVGMK
ncbi:MAG: adenylate/guanylate cyclase domain-containing protein [Solibacillus sp.]